MKRSDPYIEVTQWMGKAAATLAEWLLSNEELDDATKRDRINICYQKVDAQSKRYSQEIRSLLHATLKAEAQTFLMR